MSGDDVTVEFNEMVEVAIAEENGDMGYVVFTSKSKFSYKGTPNEDLAVFTLVLKKTGDTDDSWRVVHGQRSTGRKFEEDAPNFSV